MTKYNVHVFAVVRVLYQDIEAESQIDAVAKAKDLAFKDLRHRFNNDDIEFSEDISHYLVDEVGDEEYLNSEFYDDGIHVQTTQQSSLAAFIG